VNLHGANELNNGRGRPKSALEHFQSKPSLTKKQAQKNHLKQGKVKEHELTKEQYRLPSMEAETS
jgi:hypothetical protein